MAAGRVPSANPSSRTTRPEWVELCRELNRSRAVLDNGRSNAILARLPRVPNRCFEGYGVSAAKVA